jgi:hypothetical protein
LRGLKVVLSIAILLAAALASAAPAGAKTLYSQRGKLTKQNLGISSQDFTGTDQDGFDAQAADDFVVPNKRTWKVTQVDLDGGYAQGATQLAKSFNVFFYKNDGGLPGKLVKTEKNLKSSVANFANAIKLKDPVHLSGGHFWVSVQAVGDANDTQFVWAFRKTQAAHSPAAWQNPGGGYTPDCTTWMPAGPCVGVNYKELSFDLKGKSKRTRHAAVASSPGASG